MLRLTKQLRPGIPCPPALAASQTSTNKGSKEGPQDDPWGKQGLKEQFLYRWLVCRPGNNS